MQHLTRSRIIEPVADLLLLAFDDHDGDDVVEVTIPDDLSELSDDDLAALREQAATAFDGLHDQDDVSADDLAAMQALAEGIEAIDTETAGREQSRAEARAAADALAERVHGAADETGAEGEATTQDDGDETDTDGEGDGDDEDSDGGEDSDGDGDEDEDDGEDADEGAAETVTAAARPGRRRQRVRVPLSAMRGRAPEPPVDEHAAGLVTIVAAADLPGYSPGSHLSTTQVAESMHARARHLGERHSAPIASISVPTNGRIERGMDRDAMDAVLASVSAPPAGGAEALIAAGGWCAPSQTLYDLFSIEGRDGLVDVPSVTVDRGGIEYVENGGPSIGDVIDVPWLWTEQNDVDALDPEGEDYTTKPCVRVPCPEWVEERLDAHGICITHGNLADRAYPEMTRRFVDLVVSAHLHVMNGRFITSMVADSLAETMPASFGAMSPVLDAVEWQIVDYRDKYRMPLGASVEVVFPHWLRALMRADYGRRNGITEASVTDQQITAWLVQRGARPQWVYDYQTLVRGPGEVSAPLPTEVEFLLYAAGTFVQGRGGTIDLGVSRDSRLNETNDHTVAFTEDLYLMAKRGHESRRVTVPIDPSGCTGGLVACGETGGGE